jgi:hypothetical protein
VSFTASPIVENPTSGTPAYLLAKPSAHPKYVPFLHSRVVVPDPFGAAGSGVSGIVTEHLSTQFVMVEDRSNNRRFVNYKSKWEYMSK